MSQHTLSARKTIQRAGRASTSLLAIVAIALSASAASGLSRGAPAEPKITVEAERTALGAKISMKGQGFAPVARIKVTATRAPGANGTQDFGTVSADSAGKFQLRKTVGCTSTSNTDGNDKVTFTAADSATGAKATAQVLGGAWVCQS